MRTSETTTPLQTDVDVHNHTTVTFNASYGHALSDRTRVHTRRSRAHVRSCPAMADEGAHLLEKVVRAAATPQTSKCPMSTNTETRLKRHMTSFKARTAR